MSVRHVPSGRRILIVSPNWVGDAVMAQPLLRLLKSCSDFQGVAIDVLSSPAVAAVWRAVPEVTDVIEAAFRPGKLEWGKRRALAIRLRATGYSDAYILPNSLKSSLIPWLARIPRRVGYRGEARYGLLTVMHYDTDAVPRPMVAFYAALASSPRQDFPGRSGYPRPLMVVAEKQREGVLKHFGITTGSPIVVFAPGAEFGNAKRWPATHFAALSKMVLREQPTATILLLGSPKDRPVCQEIATLASVAPGAPSAPHLHDLAGATTLEQAIALIAAASAIVSNDSGLLHVASALNRPVLALYGPTDPNHAPPLSDVAQSIHLNLPCMPCRQRECPLGHHDCMRKLDANMVWAPLRPILGAEISRSK